MPSSITHAYIGLDTINKLDLKPKKIIENHIDNFKIYCQSMDVLYFYHIMLLFNNKVMDVGHRFHQEKVLESFKLLINDNKKNKDSELFTLIAGLITHYKADSIMHPFIDYLAHNSNNRLRIDKHFEIETYIDNYFINQKEKGNYKRINNGKLIFNYTKKPIIKDEINKLFMDLFNKPNMGSKYFRSLDEMSFVFKYIRHDKYGIKKKIFQLIDLNPFHIRKTKYLSSHFDLDNNKYYLNLDNKTWFNYQNKEIKSNKSFLDLYNDVINQSSSIINELYKYIYENKKLDLYKLIGNNSYATGLSISPNKK